MLFNFCRGMKGPAEAFLPALPACPVRALQVGLCSCVISSTGGDISLSFHRSRDKKGSASHQTFVPPYAAGSLMSLPGVECAENPTRSCLFKYCLWLQFSADCRTKIQVSVEDKKIIHFHLENKAEQRSFFQLF